MPVIVSSAVTAEVVVLSVATRATANTVASTVSAHFFIVLFSPGFQRSQYLYVG
jgi:hypothetical protein